MLVSLKQWYPISSHGHEEEPRRKKENEQPMVDDIPANTVNDPADATANKTALNAEPDLATADEVTH
jgi:hypothetical protein